MLNITLAELSSKKAAVKVNAENQNDENAEKELGKKVLEIVQDELDKDREDEEEKENKKLNEDSVDDQANTKIEKENDNFERELGKKVLEIVEDELEDKKSKDEEERENKLDDDDDDDEVNDELQYDLSTKDADDDDFNEADDDEKFALSDEEIEGKLDQSKKDAFFGRRRRRSRRRRRVWTRRRRSRRRRRVWKAIKKIGKAVKCPAQCVAFYACLKKTTGAGYFLCRHLTRGCKCHPFKKK